MGEQMAWNDPLHDAAGRGDVGQLVYMLEYSALQVDARDNDGWTPLHCAAALGQLETVKELLRRGADVNARNYDGITPLLAAAYEGHHRVAATLMEFQADPNASDYNEVSPLVAAHGMGHAHMVDMLIAEGARG
uniref:Uncharacterized protein n=1 Tax=Magnetococcus massalia (strain MO-1) TaxID=451514 RepID=A0A1S7LEF2_MAGMO|nr:conserved protein of unknown function[Include Ank repeats] [Candidatus Magnetococcus massalia]